MTPLFIFGICFTIAVALVLLFMIIFGANSLLLVIIFPALMAEQITGERGLDFGRKSFVYLFFIGMFVIAEIALIASVFFGLYCLFFGYPIDVDSSGVYQITTSDINRMFVINKILLTLVFYFTLQFIYFSIKHRDRFKQFDRFHFFLYRVLPIVSLPIAFIYLWSSYNYLLKYPNAATIHSAIITLSYIYIIYILYSLVKSIHSYVHLFSHGITKMPFYFWFTNSIGLMYDGLFIYFFYQLNFVW